MKTSGQQKSRQAKLRITYREADRIRFCLISDQDVLGSREVGMLIKILDDVYPRRRNRQTSFWGPLLIGIGVGLAVALGMLLLW